MHKCLYIVCPSDYLEPVIQCRFKGQKYFYTSLGNALPMDDCTVRHLAEIIEKEGIQEVAFILSEDNAIVLDALSGQKFIEISGLYDAYCHLLRHNKQVTNTWVMSNRNIMVLSRHLNEKINKLKIELHPYLSNLPEISGKLFSKSCNSFIQIYGELVCIHSSNLN